MKQFILLFMLLTITSLSFAASDPFPQSSTPPTVADFLPTPNNTYYCAPSTATPAGNNTTGDGSISSPWVDLIGASSGGSGTPVASGDLIYFRGGTYPAYSLVNFSRSQNILSINGTSENPIVLTNYPGEVAQWSDTVIWSMTLDGDYQILIGSDVTGNKGIKFTGGISYREDNIKIINCEFVTGTSNGGDLNPAMISQPVTTMSNNVTISYNYFHDSRCVDSSGNINTCSGAIKMSGVRLFSNTGTTIEYNLFEDMEVSDGGCVYFKDATLSAVVRHNRIINGGQVAVAYYGQDGLRPNGTEDLLIYGNLIKTVTRAFNYRDENPTGLRIYDNVVLGADYIYGYTNGNSVPTPTSDMGEVYDNIFDGYSSWIADNGANASNPDHMPTYWDYNLWYRLSDIDGPANNPPSIGWVWPIAYSQNPVISLDVVTYSEATQTATVADDYAGRSAGRTGGDIGGFIFSSVTSPTNVISTTDNQTVSNPSFTIQGTATATTGRTITGVTIPGETVTPDDGVWDEQVEAWTSNVTLPEGLSSYIATASDGTETGPDSINVTYTQVVSTISTNSSNSAGCMIR